MIGTSLNQFQIAAKLGGIGEVYPAQDARMGREVATDLSRRKHFQSHPLLGAANCTIEDLRDGKVGATNG